VTGSTFSDFADALITPAEVPAEQEQEQEPGPVPVQELAELVGLPVVETAEVRVVDKGAVLEKATSHSQPSRTKPHSWPG
jgi:hypothetical protein